MESIPPKGTHAILGTLVKLGKRIIKRCRAHAYPVVGSRD